MSHLTAEHIVTEMDYKENIAYLLEDEKDFAATEYKVLTAQGDDGYAPCMRMKYNGKIQLFYLTRNLKRFSELFYTLDSNHLSVLIGNVLTAFINVRNNGFLKCENIVISFDKIFVDSTFRVSLIYLPLARSAYADEGAAENVLRTQLIKYIDALPTATKEVFSIRAMCADGKLSLEKIVSRIGVSSEASVKEEPAKEKPVQKEPPAKKPNVNTLILSSAKDKRRTIVNRPVFLIGKNAAQVNYVITANNTVSRIHCKLVRTENGYTVMDMNSSNGTFLNGKRLSPKVPVELHHGDLLRLSNVEFSVNM